MTVAFVTFGCRLNRAEALDLEAAYAAAGWDVLANVPQDRSPDRIVVRGCSVTEKAARDCARAIARLTRLHPETEILRTGCLAGASRTVGPATGIGRSEASVPLSTSRAYLKVQDGCAGHCAYCIVPHFRGKPVSVPFADVLRKARAFLKAGYAELVITGCNLALYRSDGQDLPDLVEALAGLSETSYRLRLGSLEPSHAIARLPEIMANRRERFCPFLHLSLQSGAPPILAAMRRPYGIDTVAAFCREARRRLGSRLMLGADVITGFPGETEADFRMTSRFLEEHAFANVHVFPFSERPGTPAATMAPVVPPVERQARARILRDEAAHRKAVFARSFVGTDVTVCVEKSGLNGRTAEGLGCTFDRRQARRTLVRINVTGTDGDRLVGRVAASPTP